MGSSSRKFTAVTNRTLLVLKVTSVFSIHHYTIDNRLQNLLSATFDESSCDCTLIVYCCMCGFKRVIHFGNHLYYTGHALWFLFPKKELTHKRHSFGNQILFLSVGNCEVSITNRMLMLKSERVLKKTLNICVLEHCCCCLLLLMTTIVVMTTQN